jgi:hypothetical protein
MRRYRWGARSLSLLIRGGRLPPLYTSNLWQLIMEMDGVCAG